MNIFSIKNEILSIKSRVMAWSPEEMELDVSTFVPIEAALKELMVHIENLPEDERQTLKPLLAELKHEVSLRYAQAQEALSTIQEKILLSKRHKKGVKEYLR